VISHIEKLFEFSSLLQGHPRLLQEFVVRFSRIKAPRGDFRMGFSIQGFLNGLLENPSIFWAIIRGIKNDIKINFPSLQNLLLPECITHRENIITKALSDDNIIKSRDDVCINKMTWGEVEYYGGAYLSPLGDNKFEIRIPLPILCALHDTQMYIPEEPIYNLDDDISSEDNEKQDIATIISKIYIPFMVFARYELDLHEIYNGFPQNKYIIKTPSCWRITKNLSQVKLLEDISLLKASSLGFINAAHASFADGWIIFYSPKGEMIVLIIQSKRIKTRKDQNSEVPAKLVVDELEKVFGVEVVRNSNNLKLKGVQYIFMFITDKNSIANTNLPEDVYLIPKPKHKDFYGRYRELVRNLHDTEKPPKNKEPKEVEESITSNFDIDDFIKQFLKEKKRYKKSENRN